MFNLRCYGTIEALVVRVRSLEDQVAELKVEFAITPSKEYTNAFELMDPGILGRAPEPIDPLPVDDVKCQGLCSSTT